VSGYGTKMRPAHHWHLIVRRELNSRETCNYILSNASVETRRNSLLKCKDRAIGSNAHLEMVFLGMSIAGFARLGFTSSLAFADRLGLTSSLALADWFGFINGLALTCWFSLFRGHVFTGIFGFFNVFVIVYVPGLADVITCADKFGLVGITIFIIVRTYCRRCHVATTKLIGRCAC